MQFQKQNIRKFAKKKWKFALISYMETEMSQYCFWKDIQS